MSVQATLDEARRVAGPDPRKQVLYLAAMVEGLLSAAQGGISAGYVRKAHGEVMAADEPVEAILAAWERIEGIDGDD